MKKTIVFIISVFLILTVASISSAAHEKKAADETAKKEAAPVEKKAGEKKYQVTGDIAAIDTNGKTITVKGRKTGEVVLTADDKMIADVKAGDRVIVQYTKSGGKNIAKSLKKDTANKPEEKKPAEKK